ncbi:MAG: hypothetical protein M3Y24_03250 [Acidobacteriota bacterium]|nr:hypothetical protein [Acidobacteriota bacterium]
MRALCIAAMLVGPFTALRADTHSVIKTTVAGHETVFTQYMQGMNMRTEDLSDDVARRRVTIYNFERKARYALDLESREYVEWHAQSPDLILCLAQRIARPPRIRESGKVVNIYYETIDTGEQKQFFGRTAKHLLMRERHVAEPGACEHTYQTEKDGWYIPRAKPGTTKGSYHLVSYRSFTGPKHVPRQSVKARRSVTAWGASS